MFDAQLADKLEECAKWATENAWAYPLDAVDTLLEAADRLRPNKQALMAECHALRLDIASLELELKQTRENLRVYAARAERAEREVRRGRDG